MTRHMSQFTWRDKPWQKYCSLVHFITLNRHSRYKVLKCSKHQSGRPFLKKSKGQLTAIMYSVVQKLTILRNSLFETRFFKSETRPKSLELKLLGSGQSRPVVSICISLIRLSNLLTQPGGTCFQIRLETIAECQWMLPDNGWVDIFLCGVILPFESGDHAKQAVWKNQELN